MKYKVEIGYTVITEHIIEATSRKEAREKAKVLELSTNKSDVEGRIVQVYNGCCLEIKA